jgi:hypothetical protein
VVAVERTDDTEEALLDGTLTAALSLLSSALPLTFLQELVAVASEKHTGRPRALLLPFDVNVPENL